MIAVVAPGPGERIICRLLGSAGGCGVSVAITVTPVAGDPSSHATRPASTPPRWMVTLMELTESAVTCTTGIRASRSAGSAPAATAICKISLSGM